MQNSNDISFYIQQKLLWSQLPSNIRSKLGHDSAEYNKAILSHSLQNQLRFKSSLIAKVFKNEKKYYEKLLNYSRDNMLLYPYHLQDIIVTGLRITSFMYYIDMLCQTMSQEKSYDFIPNFTAADCLRLLGIGRNQYIDLMNNLRGLYSSSASLGPTSSVVNVGRRFLGLSTANPRKDLLDKIRSILPQSPLETVVIEPWWIVNVGVVLEPDIATSSQAIKDLIDYIIDKGQIIAGTLDRIELKQLYRLGMVYFDVPIEPSSTISVPTLEGFVMNRTTGDYFETLLYKIFVAIDEHNTVEGLSQILQIPLQHVQQAISVFCRLQFANKKSSNLSSNMAQHSSWNGFMSPSLRNSECNNNSNKDNVFMKNFLLDETEDDNFSPDILNLRSITCSSSMFLSPSPSTDAVDVLTKLNTQSYEDNSLAINQSKKLAFIFDSSLTAYLMMGNLSVGLKNHAVTMFEVGKLSEESLDSFLNELDEISDVGEGEAQRYYEHAVNLRQTIRKLRNIASGYGVDLLRCGSLFSLDCGSRTRMLTRNYKCLISMAPINYHSTSDNNPQNNSINGDGGAYSSSDLALSTNPELPHFGPIIPEVTSIWFKLYLYMVTSSGPPTILLTNGYRLKRLPLQFYSYTKLLITPWQQESVVISIHCALVTINDALTHSPMLVQGYDLDGIITEKHIVFPLNVKDIHPIELSNLLDKIDQNFDLKSNCGYISYLDNRSKDTNQCSIMMLNLHFGVPLFDNDLNCLVLEQLTNMKLFSKEESDKSLAQDSMRTLAIRLLEFIECNGGCSNSFVWHNNTDASVKSFSVHKFGDIPLPTKILFFHDGKFDYFTS